MLVILAVLFALFVLVARILSGVHWITDIIGGIIFGIGSVGLYYSLA